MKMPEEVNRVLTDRISDVLFAPTARSVDNLMDEGYGDMGVAVVNSGDVMYDVSEYYASYAKCPAFMNDSTDLPFVLCTIHRAENTDDKERLASIIGELNEISKKMKVVFPLHPRTRNMLVKYGLDVSKLHITEPVGYFEIAWLLQNCAFVVTDSGGLQKEAYFHKKTCIILREETEWIELVNCGCNALVGSKVTGILDKYEHLTKSCSFEQNLYGSGDASKKIIKYLINEGR
jgi:UDP-GlcNAc3NAcA epimerase